MSLCPRNQDTATDYLPAGCPVTFLQSYEEGVKVQWRLIKQGLLVPDKTKQTLMTVEGIVNVKPCHNPLDKQTTAAQGLLSRCSVTAACWTRQKGF